MRLSEPCPYLFVGCLCGALSALIAQLVIAGTLRFRPDCDRTIGQLRVDNCLFNALFNCASLGAEVCFVKSHVEHLCMMMTCYMGTAVAPTATLCHGHDGSKGRARRSLSTVQLQHGMETALAVVAVIH